MIATTPYSEGIIRTRPVGFLQGALTALALLALAHDAWGEAAEALRRGRELVDEFEFAAAIEQFESVVADRDARAAQRVEALELLTVLHFNMDDLTPARQTYRRLLGLDPGHEPTDTGYPPRLLEFFDSVRDEVVPQAELSVQAVARQEAPGRGPVLIEATLEGEGGGVEAVAAFVRSAGEAGFERAPMARAGGHFVVEVPASDAATGLEYYVQAEAPSGFVLASEGSADEPRPFLPSPVEEGGGAETRTPEGGEEPVEGEGASRGGRWYASWWFWTIVGVVIAGGVSAAVVLTLPPAQEAGTLGTRSLP